MSYKIFETGMYDYSDDPRVNVTKPVLYTPQFFEEMLKDIGSVPLDIGHKGEAIGSLVNINFKDNCLYADTDTNDDLKIKGISPVFAYDTLDRGSYLEAVNGEFTGAGVTDTPRTHITYNSYPNNKEDEKGDKMVSEEAFEQITKQNSKLQRQLATTENQLEANKEQLKRLSELEAENKSLRAENEKYSSELEQIRPTAQKYIDYETSKRESLIEELSKEDASLKDKIKDMDINVLELLKEQRTVNIEPQGISSQGAEGQNEGDGEPKPTPNPDGKMTSEECDEFYTTLYGEE